LKDGRRLKTLRDAAHLALAPATRDAENPHPRYAALLLMKAGGRNATSADIAGAALELARALKAEGMM
jgi:hypothetical protein